MGRYRKILVAVDGSESSVNAFRQACKVVREDKSWVTVVTTIPTLQDQFATLNVREKAAKALRSEGEGILAAIRKAAEEEDIKIKSRLEEGSPMDAIKAITDENGFDLIVMGRKGRSGTASAMVGSVTARVIGHVKKDVLVVPKGSSLGWDRVLLATDGSGCCSSAAARAIDIARSYGGRLYALSVVDVTEEFMAQAPDAVEKLVQNSKALLAVIGKDAEASGVVMETVVKEGEPSSRIAELAAEKGISVIIMGSHGRTGLKRLLMGSVTEKVIGHAPCPVLVVWSGV